MPYALNIFTGQFDYYSGTSAPAGDGFLFTDSSGLNFTDSTGFNFIT